MIDDVLLYSGLFTGMFFLLIVTIWPIGRLYTRYGVLGLAHPLGIMGLTYFIYFGVGSIFPFLDNSNLILPESIRLFPQAMIIASFGYAMMLFGFMSGSMLLYRGRLTFGLTLNNKSSKTWPINKMKKLLLPLVAVLWGMRVWNFSHGLFFKVFNTEAYFQSLPTIDRSIYILSYQLAFFVVSYFSHYTAEDKIRTGHIKHVFIAYIFIEMVYWFMANYRTEVVIVLLNVLIVFALVYFKKSIRVKIQYKKIIYFMIFGLLTIFIIIPFGDAMRYRSPHVIVSNGRQGNIAEQVLSNLLPDAFQYFQSDYGELLIGRLYQSTRMNRLAADDMFSAVILRHQEGMYPLMYGDSIVSNLPLLVPRVFWPGKPNLGMDEQSEGRILVHNHLWLTDTMISPVTEFYANWDIMGVLFGMMIIGIIMRIYTWAVLERTGLSPAGILLYSTTILSLVKVEQDVVSFLGVGRNIFIFAIVVIMLNSILSQPHGSGNIIHGRLYENKHERA